MSDLTAKTALIFLAESDLLESQQIEVSEPNSEGEIHLIFQSWESIGLVNDALNAEFSGVAWNGEGADLGARTVYIVAANAYATEQMKDANWQYSTFSRKFAPDIHSSNIGPTGGPFGSMRTKNGSLELGSVNMRGNSAPALMPAGLVSIDEIAGLLVCFYDDTALCGDCRASMDKLSANLCDQSSDWTCDSCFKEYDLEDAS